MAEREPWEKQPLIKSAAAERAERLLNDEGVTRLLEDVEAMSKAPGPTPGQNEVIRGYKPGDEVRITSETGGQKGSKLARFSLLPWDILREVAEHYGRGTRKYADRNWQRGYKWSLSYDALCRHLESFWNRDDIDLDPELYLPTEPKTARHIIAVVWHALALAWFSRYGVGEDDRPATPTRFVPGSHDRT